MKFYSVVLRKRIDVTDNKVRKVTRKVRKLAVRMYIATQKATGKTKEHEARRIMVKG